MATWVVLVGSPYALGKCARVGRALAQEIGAASQSTTTFFSVSDLDVRGCIGCDACKDEGVCIYNDDAQTVQVALDAADAVLVIAPIYFAGVPSQLKALLDRFQPYFWKRQALLDQQRQLPAKRPLVLALVGEGGDPYGAEHAFASLASPLALADLGAVDQHTFIQEDEAAIVATLSATVARIQEGLR